MKHNYSIDEILSAVDEIQRKKKEVRSKTMSSHLVKKDYSEVPAHTLKLIEQAEDVK
tara:strand:- start:67 stop:237 length:171 start_codon:yes stop_codon:yes gene_type:complete